MILNDLLIEARRAKLSQTITIKQCLFWCSVSIWKTFLV